MAVQNFSYLPEHCDFVSSAASSTKPASLQHCLWSVTGVFWEFSAISSAKRRTSTHPLRITIMKPLQLDPPHQPGQTVELLLPLLMWQTGVVFLSRGTNYTLWELIWRHDCKSRRFFFLKQKPNITETPSGQLVKRFSVYQDPEIVYHNLI